MSDNNGGRSLGGGAGEPLPTGWGQSDSTRRIGRIGDLSSSSGSSGRGESTPRIRSLRDIIGGNGSPASGPAGDHGNDDSDDEDEEGESWFAGGERSGISVQNPDRPGGGGVPGGNMVRDLLRRAAEAGPPPVPEEVNRRFAGGGHTLGSDEVESAYVPDPTADSTRQEPTIRHLTFWRDGFTVEDGELMRYDDPNNEQVLAEIHSGHAPPSLLNVRPGEPVELRVAKRTEQDYIPPQRAAFSGDGHRLGSPVPHIIGAGVTSPNMPGSFEALVASTGAFENVVASSSSSRPEPDSVNTKFEVDQSKPMTSVQVRLADGTRMVCRMNLTHTVLDLRNFINASRPENLTRPYTIGTTFPNRTLDDLNATIEAAGLKNSVVVQKWE
ncbi:hypothetical protein BDP27DRAFT_1309330 [Rhodocollybia butyracea]|uniref:SEP-domain-containing protein n=1 Tax=Rhodocollybia butyracea TaxID=206335 RepID=A0A9P5UH05_9AGAR|nr:hypothetical protein BDP27DRAFT_1309330 [Rhodocollybia butyracea]